MSIAFSTSRDQSLALAAALVDISAICHMQSVGTDRQSERGRVIEGHDHAFAEAWNRALAVAPTLREVMQACITATAIQGSNADAREAELLAMIAAASGPVKAYLERDLKAYQAKRARMAAAKQKAKTATVETDEPAF